MQIPYCEGNHTLARKNDSFSKVAVDVLTINIYHLQKISYFSRNFSAVVSYLTWMMKKPLLTF